MAVIYLQQLRITDGRILKTTLGITTGVQIEGILALTQELTRSRLFKLVDYSSPLLF